MRKIIKVKPSLPQREFIAFDLLDDNCYGCKKKSGCNNCKRAKRYVERKIKKFKGSKESTNKKVLDWRKN